MKKELLVILLLLLPVVHAQLDVSEYSIHTEKELPSLLKPVFGNERMNIHILQADERVQQVSVVTENGVLIAVANEPVEDATLDVFVDEENVKNLQNTENKLSAFQAMLDDGRIEYTPVGFFRKIKFFFSKMLLKVASWFQKEEAVCGNEVLEIRESCDGYESLSRLDRQDGVQCNLRCAFYQEVKFWATPSGADLYIDGELAASQMEGEVFINLTEGEYVYKFVYENTEKEGTVTVPLRGVGATNGINVRFR